LAKYATGAQLLLNRSNKLTPALEQMNPQPDLIISLNQSPDPGVPYTILAGDISKYAEPMDRLFPQLLTRVGQSTAFQELFAEKANDIAVGVASVLALGVSGCERPLWVRISHSTPISPMSAPRPKADIWLSLLPSSSPGWVTRSALQDRSSTIRRRRTPPPPARVHRSAFTDRGCCCR
jgi:hypothetical protein